MAYSRLNVNSVYDDVVIIDVVILITDTGNKFIGGSTIGKKLYHMFFSPYESNISCYGHLAATAA
ncbi:hypothetical protein DERF_011881 [Dermatophagoides farinae]|uniref:Uncharacterized protein n=1 Tax=Dermatophagoides farinae TaxID=6954 RepID=A0A922HNT1_DERFA|nr:hypothetical protein DERF_011881 [Dermatophagoides farinae]